MTQTTTRPKPHPSTSAIYAFAEELRREMITEYGAVREAQYAAAVDATNGNMVNARGKYLGVDSWAVFESPTLRAAYGSPELLEHLDAHPRTTRTEFEAAWLERWRSGDQAA